VGGPRPQAAQLVGEAASLGETTGLSSCRSHVSLTDTAARLACRPASQRGVSSLVRLPLGAEPS